MRETYGYAKQGVGYGYNKVKGLNALLGIVSTAVSAPIIVAHRLREGPVSSARGAGKFLSDAIAAARLLNLVLDTDDGRGNRHQGVRRG